MFTTQMEPNFCRMFVPCIDEPARKTVFRIDVVTAHEKTVLSNMPERRVEFLDNRLKRT